MESTQFNQVGAGTRVRDRAEGPVAPGYGWGIAVFILGILSICGFSVITAIPAIMYANYGYDTTEEGFAVLGNALAWIAVFLTAIAAFFVMLALVLR